MSTSGSQLVPLFGKVLELLAAAWSLAGGSIHWEWTLLFYSPAPLSVPFVFPECSDNVASQCLAPAIMPLLDAAMSSLPWWDETSGNVSPDECFVPSVAYVRVSYHTTRQQLRHIAHRNIGIPFSHLILGSLLPDTALRSFKHQSSWRNFFWILFWTGKLKALVNPW